MRAGRGTTGPDCPVSSGKMGFCISWEPWLEVEPQDFHPALFRLALPRVVRHVEFVTLPGPQRPVIERTSIPGQDHLPSDVHDCLEQPLVVLPTELVLIDLPGRSHALHVGWVEVEQRPGRIVPLD